MKKSKKKGYSVTKDVKDLTTKKTTPPTMNPNKSDGVVKNMFKSSFRNG